MASKPVKKPTKTAPPENDLSVWAAKKGTTLKVTVLRSGCHTSEEQDMELEFDEGGGLVCLHTAENCSSRDILKNAVIWRKYNGMLYGIPAMIEAYYLDDWGLVTIKMKELRKAFRRLPDDDPSALEIIAQVNKVRAEY